MLWALRCTHLGCLANWNRVVNKFVRGVPGATVAQGPPRCPCHGSEYDASGQVIKGPAPRSLQLAHVELTESQKEPRL